MTKRCAIYTRKSSEEGLEQDFNSLDAQREACEAYIRSQAGEGWTALPDRYDDGGFSGGSMERPGLQRLLADIARERVDVVVVYKIDRLTRSLPDFARIVEQFDARSVSFVSVTQAFNTTTSMGRLTLNVLLSFAQFEREVTGERIRDKIAASKAKGMWMGGLAPLGYDLPTNGTRVLSVNPDEAAKVRHIFDRYLALKSVNRLLQELARDGIVSKRRTTAKGIGTGGQPFSRGAMFHLLQNRVYVGEIVHKGQRYPGQHEGIVDRATFDAVQALLTSQGHERRARRTIASPLSGKLFDSEGHRLTPTHSRSANGSTYRYYIRSRVLQGKDQQSAAHRYPAKQVEQLLSQLVARIADCTPNTLRSLERAELAADQVHLLLPARLLARVRAVLRDGEWVEPDAQDSSLIRWTVPAVLKSRGGRAQVRGQIAATPNRDPTLIKALRAAHALVRFDRNGQPSAQRMPASKYERRLMRLALLSPSIQQAILAGLQPPRLRLGDLMRAPIPTAWNDQEEPVRKLASA